MGSPGLLGHRVCLTARSPGGRKAGACEAGTGWREPESGAGLEPGMGAVETGATTSLECLLGGMQWKRGAAAEQQK